MCGGKTPIILHMHDSEAAQQNLHAVAMELMDAASTHAKQHPFAAASRPLGECFKLFDVIHQITTTCAAITRIAREVLEDMAADNVDYAELRTTPKVRGMCCVGEHTAHLHLVERRLSRSPCCIANTSAAAAYHPLTS